MIADSSAAGTVPPDHVLSAFGATRPPVPVDGGQGTTCRAGDVVLKPGADNEETRWIATFYDSVDQHGFRVPKPIRTPEGAVVCHGWQAWERLAGRHEPDRWEEKLAVCARFHEAIAQWPKPAFMQRREQNPWVVADAVTWGERTYQHHPQIEPLVGRLSALLRPVDAVSQLIHGDFGGNVLFSESLPPAVIDFSPYWRPAAVAAGVVIADAIVWEDADMSLLDQGERLDGFSQHMIRAELRRIIELETMYDIYGRDVFDQTDAHRPLVEELCARYG